MDVEHEERLLRLAREVRSLAYAPYSRYTVGAAVLDDRGRCYAACNVENISFGATLCAERAAISAMVADGGRRIRGMALATEDGGLPCGICLQTILEFADEAESLIIVVATSNGSLQRLKFKQLFPYGFSSDEVSKQNQSTL